MGGQEQSAQSASHALVRSPLGGFNNPVSGGWAPKAREGEPYACFRCKGFMKDCPGYKFCAFDSNIFASNR